jgi:Immunity protein 22
MPARRPRAAKKAKDELRSIYEFERKNVLSMWVAIVPLSEIPDEYFQQQEDEDENAFTPFSRDFGFGAYGLDSLETNIVGERIKTFDQLVGQLSFSKSFVEQAVAAARKQGLENAQGVFVLYEIDYRPKMAGASKSPYMAFLGSFKYDPEADSVLPFAT